METLWRRLSEHALSVPYRVVLLEVISGLLLGVAPDLPDEDDALRLWVP